MRRRRNRRRSDRALSAWRASIRLDKVGSAPPGGVEPITNTGFVLDYFEARHAETLASAGFVGEGRPDPNPGGGKAQK